MTNSKTLELMGLARLMDALDANAVRAWLMPPPLARLSTPMWPASWRAGWRTERRRACRRSRRLWARTLFPEEVCDRLSELEGAAR